MKQLDPLQSARAAVAANANRPATAVIHDSDDVRLVVFHLSPGQHVPSHTSHSTVTLTVLEGTGTLSGSDGERECTRGNVVVYERNELHGMKAGSEDLFLLAAIAPRPGTLISITKDQ